MERPIEEFVQFEEIYKKIQESLLDFIDNSIDEDEEKYQCFIKLINRYNIFANKEKIKMVLHMISAISKNHQRHDSFHNKLEQIIMIFNDSFQCHFTNDELFYFFLNNKRLLLALFENNIITNISELMKKKIIHYKKTDANYAEYFYPEIRDALDSIQRSEFQMEETIRDIDNFNNKRLEGENDSYICYLIRKDLIDNFISFVNQYDITLSESIPHSIYETNDFLIDKSPTLIEYSAFFGSIQIFKYLLKNNAPIPNSILNYAAHGCHQEIFDTFLLDETIKKQFNQEHYFQSFLESIKCHHFDVFGYIKDYIQIKEPENILIGKKAIKSFNFCHFSNGIDDELLLYKFCKYDYFDLAKILLKNRSIDISSSDQKKSFFRAASKNNNFNLLNILFQQNNIRLCKFDFARLKSITELVIFPTVASINEFTFYDCINLQKIDLNCHIKSIKKRTFDGCISLKEIIIPSSVENIENGAFSNCESLSKVVFSPPFNIEIIGNCAFSDCSSLTKIDLPSSLRSLDPKVFEGCSLLYSVSIPEKITSLNHGLFERCHNLMFISIPSSVTKIESSAFEECLSLKQVIIPSSVTIIDSFAFSKCSSLKEIEIPSSVVEIRCGAFFKCSSMTHISIPPSISKIYNNTFEECTSLKEIIIPSSVTEILHNAFDICSSLTHISIPSSVEVIEKYSFSGCEKLVKVDFPPNLKKICEYAFFECSSLIEAIIPPSVEKIYWCAFKGCVSLQNIIIPPLVGFLGYAVFRGCSSLKKIEIPERIDVIPKWAFYECTALSDVFLHNKITCIEEGAFKQCYSLKQLTINSSASFDEFSMHNCTSLEEIIVTNENQPLYISFKETSFTNCYSIKHIKAPKGTKIQCPSFIDVLWI